MWLRPSGDVKVVTDARIPTKNQILLSFEQFWNQHWGYLKRLSLCKDIKTSKLIFYWNPAHLQKKNKKDSKPLFHKGKKSLFKRLHLVNSSHILYSHIVRVSGFLPRHRWMLITQDCMIHGVNSERTERSSEEMKGHDEETYPYSSLCLSPLHFQPQSISLTRKYWLVCNYEVMLPTAVRHSKSQHLPLFIHCYSSTRNTL